MFYFTKTNWIFSGSLKNELESLDDWAYQWWFDSLDTRTEKQNAFIWGVVYPQVIHLYETIWIQITSKDAHEYYKWQFLKKRKKCKITKRFRTIEWSTTELSRKTFSEYIKKIDNDCIQKFGVWLDLSDGRDLLYYDSIIN